MPNRFLLAGESLPDHSAQITKPWTKAAGDKGIIGGYYFTYPFKVGVGEYTFEWTAYLKDNRKLCSLVKSLFANAGVTDGKFYILL